MRINHLSLLLNKRRTRNRKHKQNFPYFLSRTGFAFITLVSLLFMVFISLAGFTYADLTTDLPSLENLPLMLNPDDGLLQQPTRIYDRSGQTVLLTLENPGIPRNYFSINPDAPRHFSPQLVQIVVALNEPDFWRSPGFAWKNLLDPQPRTIAEYLVNDLLLESEPAGMRRSLRMRLLAAQVVSEYGRIQVLEWYLNSVYFGHLAYGADSAAQLYLGKSASDLNLAEVVLLVSLIETPALNPLDAPAAAVERQQQVLDELESLNILNSGQIQAARQTDLLMLTEDTRAARLEQDEFTEAVLEQLEENFSLHQLERGGLKVLSTLDLQLETQLECTLAAQLKTLSGYSDQALPTDCEAASLLPTLFEPSLQLGDLSGRALLLEPASGQVLAMSGALTLSGSRDQIPEVVPGSILSPFVAMAAFSSGMSPSTQVWDLPLEDAVLQKPEALESYQGPLRLRTALANDYVTPFTNLLEQMIPENVWRLAEPLGLSGLSQSENPGSLLQEGGNISLQDVAQAYSVFANQGYLYGTRSPISAEIVSTTILRVEDLSGRVLLDLSEPDSKSLLSSQLSYLVHDVLSDDVSRQRRFGYPNALEIGRPAGVQVGEADGSRQVWTAGYTPDYLAVVWLGSPAEGEEKLDPLWAAGIWHALLQYVSRDLPSSDWTKPSGLSEVQVCDPSGLLPTSDCPMIVTELFISGNEPIAYDNLYQSFEVNRETGKLATVFTPLELIEEQTFLVLPQYAQEWGEVMGLVLPPDDYDTIQALVLQPGVKINSPEIFSYVKGSLNIGGTAGGENFLAYRLQAGKGLNPENWIQIGEEKTSPVEEGLLGVWDASGLDGLYAIRLAVQRSDNQVETAIIQVTVDNSPPQAAIFYPFQGEEIPYSYGKQVNFSLEYADNVGVSRVEWVLDGDLLAGLDQEPFIYSWTVQRGSHTLFARVVDLAGNQAESLTVNFTVK